MRSLTVDRLEGPYTICEDKDQHLFAIDTGEMPKGAIPGTVITIDDDGVITVNEEETAVRKRRIAAKQALLMRDEG